MMGTRGMVAAEHPLEAQAGLRVLEAGGNAIDAAVAVFYMTSVVEQHQAGIGGDCFVVAYIAKENRVVFFNGTGPAPKLATADFYRKLGGIPEDGPYSALVPGAVGGFALAHQRYGSQPHGRLLDLAIEIAEKGHPLTFWSASNYSSAHKKILNFPSSVRVLLNNGKPYQPSDVLLQPDLANTLRTIAKDGPDSFYRGSIARHTAAFTEREKLLIRYDDLGQYRAEESSPIHTRYKDYDVYQSAPNSQGITLLIALNILEGIDLRTMGHNSPEYLHVVTEAMKLAFADRNHYIADPRFAKDIPVSRLLSKEYAAQRRALIRRDRAIRGVAPSGAGGTPVYEDQPQPLLSSPDRSGAQGETSSFSIADRFGNVVSVTHSVNGTFGSGIVVDGAGWVLNNRMPYYSLTEGDANLLVPGKRPRHTINPALALKNGKPFLAWNTPGGDNQVQAMLQSFLSVVEFGLNVQQAVEAPTVTSTSFGAAMYPGKAANDLTIPRVLADRVAAALAEQGHRIRVTAMQGPYNQLPSGAGAVKMVLIDPRTGVMHGGVSPAKDNYVMGW